MMSKKHYTAIAAKLKYEADVAAQVRARPERAARLGMVHVIAIHLADVMQLDNPRFNRHRFLTACGVQQGGNR